MVRAYRSGILSRGKWASVSISCVSSSSASPPPRTCGPRRTTDDVGSCTGLPSASVYTGASVDWHAAGTPSNQRLIRRLRTSFGVTYLRHCQTVFFFFFFFFVALIDSGVTVLRGLQKDAKKCSQTPSHPKYTSAISHASRADRGHHDPLYKGVMAISAQCERQRLHSGPPPQQRRRNAGHPETSEGGLPGMIGLLVGLDDVLQSVALPLSCRKFTNFPNSPATCLV